MMKKTISLLLAFVLLLAMPMAAFAADDSFAAGTTDEHSYWNETLRLGCTLSDEWYFYSDEEILEANGAAADLLKDDLAEAVRESGQMMDMMALNLETGDNVNVNLERLNLTSSLMIDEKEYVEISMEQLPTAIEQMGMSDVTIEAGTMEFAGEEHACLRISGNLTIDGLEEPLPLYETLAVIKNGRTVIIVTACSYWEDTTEDILANFYRENP